MSNQFNIGDRVFVINWGNQYTQIGSSRGVFWKDDSRIDPYSGVDFFQKIIREPLTKAGKPGKRPYDAPIIRREYPWRNFKWEILDFMAYPKYDKQEYNTPYVYLLKSIDHAQYGFSLDFPCTCEIGEQGLSFLTLEQYKDNEFNSLKEAHLGQWSIERMIKEGNTFPTELLKKVYDTDDNVLFGSSIVKGKVYYTYIAAEYTTTGNPYIINVGIDYDGKGNKDLPKDTILIPYHNLPTMFPDNKFTDI